jgi:uncharacterized membrane protein
MKRTLVTLVFSLAATLGMSGLAAADGEGGEYCGASSNGCANSSDNTICSGHGSFGAFGKGNDWRGGASGDNTAFNNSTLCGNPQGAAGVNEP